MLYGYQSNFSILLLLPLFSPLFCQNPVLKIELDKRIENKSSYGMHVLCLSRNQPWYVSRRWSVNLFALPSFFLSTIYSGVVPIHFQGQFVHFCLQDKILCVTIVNMVQAAWEWKRKQKPDTFRHASRPSFTIFYNFLRSQQEAECIHSDGKSIKKDEKKAMLAGLDLSRLLALFSLVSSFLVHLSLGQSRILCPINLGPSTLA